MEIKNIHIDDVIMWSSNPNNKGGIRIHWSANIGFGVLDIFKKDDGKLYIETETMGKEFALQVLSKLVEDTIEL
jgi:hypothetical protein